MRGYLEGAISEQIHRCFSLKKLIPHPLKYTELHSLADRCERMIDENINYLNILLNELSGRREDDLEDLFRGLRSCTRDIELIECYGISALYYGTPEIGYLNKLVVQIHHEINLPLTPPAVSCISTTYYYFHPLTNVIFIPVGEHDFLLHLPDLFHEIGHEVLCSIDKQPRLKILGEKYLQAVHKITEYYSQLQMRKLRETGPRLIPMIVLHIHSQWKHYWLEEFLCDLFALYTLGPAYAWSHLHVTNKKSKNVYDFSSILPRKHPSDDARMKMLISGLNLLGFQREGQEILSKWNSLPLTKSALPEAEYQYAYPKELINEIASILFEGIKASGFNVANSSRLANLEQNSIVKLLNDAWAEFWRQPKKFRGWEEARIQQLKVKLGC